ncbi:MAG: hypothetical protein K1Y01_20800 [Vicinamibacteria bacterium]|nr:hypothetical protein [Vicinamibacteria bacterium]
MRRRPGTPLLLLAAALALHAACGKRADPLAPYVKTPLPPSGLDVSQIGDEVEIRIVAPTTTTEKRPLPVIQLEWLQGPPTGDFTKAATPLLREDVAPGEVRLKRFPRPAAEVRYTVRALNGKARSTPAGLVTFKPAPVPPPPTSLVVTNTANGVELRWTNPLGAEPWPTPSTSPTPTPSPAAGASATPGTSEAAPHPLPSPTPSPTPTPAPATPSPSPSPIPKPTPTPPTGIRIFRTDGAPRLAREPLQAAVWLDPLPKPGEKPCYALRYATSFKPLVESASTESVCAEVRDIVPPDPPGRLVADIGGTFVELSWLASPSPDVAFYRVYRTLDAAARAVAIETQGPVLRIRDPNMTRGPRAYDVVAVDKAGNESAPGAAVRVIVP